MYTEAVVVSAMDVFLCSPIFECIDRDTYRDRNRSDYRFCGGKNSRPAIYHATVGFQTSVSV